MSQRGREPSAATGLSPAEDNGGKCTSQGAQEVPFTATAGVCVICVYNIIGHECMCQQLMCYVLFTVSLYLALYARSCNYIYC